MLLPCTPLPPEMGANATTTSDAECVCVCDCLCVWCDLCNNLCAIKFESEMQVKQGTKALNQITFTGKSPTENCQNGITKEKTY